jgi:rhodanese-related sulfurtransferase
MDSAPALLERLRRRTMNKRNMEKWGSLALFTALFLALGAAYAAIQTDVPRISIQELKALIDSSSPVTIVDVRPKDIYATEHIKDAISLPYKSQIELEDVMALPEDRLIVVYCDCGPGESDSSDIAGQLKVFGYENVKVLKDPSIKGWRTAGYPMKKSK